MVNVKKANDCCLLALLLLSVLPGCQPDANHQQGSAQIDEGEPNPVRSVADRCRKLPYMHRLCGISLPNPPARPLRFSTSPSRGYETLAIEWGVPGRGGVLAKGSTYRHANLMAGTSAASRPARWFRDSPTLETSPVPHRKDPLVLDAAGWPLHGRLLLAPSYPRGGIESDHIIFFWTEDKLAYSVSYHAFRPFGQALDELKSMIASLQD